MSTSNISELLRRIGNGVVEDSICLLDKDRLKCYNIQKGFLESDLHEIVSSFSEKFNRYDDALEGTW